MKVSDLSPAYIGKVVSFPVTEDAHAHVGILQAIVYMTDARGLSIGGMVDEYKLDDFVMVVEP